jgi:hypothetical protein
MYPPTAGGCREQVYLAGSCGTKKFIKKKKQKKKTIASLGSLIKPFQ